MKKTKLIDYFKLAEPRVLSLMVVIGVAASGLGVSPTAIVSASASCSVAAIYPSY